MQRWSEKIGVVYDETIKTVNMMVQVITVSANTAAYVADAVKTPARVSRNKFVEENRRSVEGDPPPDEVQAAHVSAAISESTSAALNFLASGHDHKRGATLKETIDAYESF